MRAAAPASLAPDAAADADPDAEAWLKFLDGDAASARGGLAPFAPLLAARATRAPFVLGRMAQSLDGRIATPSGGSFWISGPEDRLHTHRLRALCDAVLVGAATIRADDPLLTTRACHGSSPVRVVLDPRRALDPSHRVFAADAPTLLLCAESPGGAGTSRAARHGAVRHGAARHGAAEILPLASDGEGRLDPARIVDVLGARGLRLLLVEGGGTTVSRFLAAGMIDRLHVTIAPLLLGQGLPGFTLPCPAEPDDGMRLEWTPYRLGEDMLFDIPIRRARPPMCR